MNRSLDQRVLDRLMGLHGSTAWAMAGAMGVSRIEISKACQRLKRKGLVKTSEMQSTFWQAVKP